MKDNMKTKLIASNVLALVAALFISIYSPSVSADVVNHEQGVSEIYQDGTCPLGEDGTTCCDQSECCDEGCDCSADGVCNCENCGCQSGSCSVDGSCCNGVGCSVDGNCCNEDSFSVDIEEGREGYAAPRF